jgi:hypothetical protein
MTVNKDTFVLFIIMLIYVGGDIYTARQAHHKLETFIKETGDYAVGAMLRNAAIENRVDSLQAQNKALAKTIIYLDSCQSEKVRKGEKAERTGRFVGGIIKGLFPHL